MASKKKVFVLKTSGSFLPAFSPSFFACVARNEAEARKKLAVVANRGSRVILDSKMPKWFPGLFEKDRFAHESGASSSCWSLPSETPEEVWDCWQKDSRAEDADCSFYIESIELV